MKNLEHELEEAKDKEHKKAKEKNGKEEEIAKVDGEPKQDNLVDITGKDKKDTSSFWARDTVEAVKEILERDKQIDEDQDIIQGPINFDTLSRVQKIKLASIAQAKAREDSLKSHIEDSELLGLASRILEIIPTFQKDSSTSPSGQLKSLINSVSSHFESLESL